MKARRVKVDPDAPFAEALGRTLAVRLDELRAFAADADDPAEVEALHGMRIAAKRVRYVLEVGEPASSRRVKAAKQLQDILGEIHDCDELLPLIRRHLRKLREEDAAAAVAGRALPHRRKYRGLEALRAHTIARRAALHEQFRRQWPRIERALLAEQVVAT